MARILDQLNKVRLNPDRVPVSWAKLNVAIVIKPFDLVATPNQTLEKLLSAHLVHDTWRVFSRSVSNHPDGVANFEMRLCHTVFKWPNDPSSATRPAGRVDCNRSAMGGCG